MTTSGDTQAFPRIPVPGPIVGHALPTIALTLVPAAVQSALEPTSARVGPVPAERTRVEPAPVAEEGPVAVAEAAPEVAAESHERIYQEAMATIAALASNWSSTVRRSSGRHRSAA